MGRLGVVALYDWSPLTGRADTMDWDAAFKGVKVVAQTTSHGTVYNEYKDTVQNMVEVMGSAAEQCKQMTDSWWLYLDPLNIGSAAEPSRGSRMGSFRILIP